ncbi:MAG TPA: SDR family oxidoreductase [Pyrinomonadaceae bacterium]|jgi:uncharacterized protein YbjT (DUF2867 family)
MTKSTPTILITGATGNIGQELAKGLSAQNIPFRAMVRSTNSAAPLATLDGAEVVVGDFNDAAKGAGVKHIVKLSQWAADKDSPVRFLSYHAAVENRIKESGIGYTFLRPNLFMQGLPAFRETIVGQGKFFAAAADAKISAVDVRDIAAVAAAALTQDGHEGKTYDLTGPEPLTHGEMAEKLSKAVGREIQYVDVPEEAMIGALLNVGLPPWQVDGLIEDYAHYRRGEAASISSGIHDATGMQPKSFDDFARDYAPAFLS